MTVLKSVLSPVLSNVLSSVLGDSIVQRYLTPLDSTFQQSYAFAATLVSGTPITLTVYPTNGNQGLPPGAPAVINNKWQVISYTTTGNTDNLCFDGIDYFDGIVWDYSAPSINVAWSLDENFAETGIVVNSATVLGSELWTGGDSVSNGSEGLFQNFAVVPLTSGISTLVRVVVSGATSGQIQVRGFTGGDITYTGNGVFEFTAEVGSGDITVRTGIIQPNNGFTLSISIKQADGYGTAIDITFSPFYTLDGTTWTSPDGPDLEIA